VLVGGGDEAGPLSARPPVKRFDELARSEVAGLVAGFDGGVPERDQAQRTCRCRAGPTEHGHALALAMPSWPGSRGWAGVWRKPKR
jgi:hypothetical protein